MAKFVLVMGCVLVSGAAVFSSRPLFLFWQPCFTCKEYPWMLEQVCDFMNKSDRITGFGPLSN